MRPMSASDLAYASDKSGLDPTARGVIAMVAGMVVQATNDTVIKLASARLPASEIMALRGVMAIALALAVALALGEARRLKTLANPLVALRSGLEAMACLTYMTALAHLSLGEFTSIVQTTPLIITALAVLLGWQTVGWKRWAAIGVGFGGVLLIAKPTTGGVNVYAALTLLSACFMAVRDLVTSRIPSSAPSMVVTLGSTIAVTAVGFGAGAAQAGPWLMPDGFETTMIVVAAGLVVGCNMLIVMAFRLGDMTVVGPFRYSVILAALILGWAVWGHTPDALSLIGSALIVGSGLYALKREKKNEPEPLANSAAPLA
ncbi:DMT family transporter [Chenggangzhangella methanolivorans]|uniref:DMT family transporter n=1 Tax=Chenggangzhangella methanolivorans TaxID=1437009 RepID=A0A9E6R8I6_9HYPH|nr:DMT family transporter [Chenggangzhangella methanolivorans]QZO00161.1 DMT family transporter [Chenggangzhangella methanolivorans]